MEEQRITCASARRRYRDRVSYLLRQIRFRRSLRLALGDVWATRRARLRCEAHLRESRAAQRRGYSQVTNLVTNDGFESDTTGWGPAPPQTRFVACYGCKSPATCLEIGCAAEKRALLDAYTKRCRSCRAILTPSYYCVMCGAYNAAPLPDVLPAAFAELRETLSWANEHRATNDSDRRRYLGALTRLDEIEATRVGR
jgi:hypothetical protein